MLGLRSAKTSHKLKSHISNALTYSEVVEGDPGSLPGGGLTLMVLVQKQLEQERQTVV
jgi:hypothetical protein